VLIADASVERAALCLESLRPFRIGTVIARHGDEAGRLLDRLGPPVLLIVDLSLSRTDGFALIEAVRARDKMRTEILAWSASRALREFAASRLAGLDVHVFSASSPAPVVVGAITRALQRRAAAPANPPIRPEDFDRVVAQLADKASRLCGTPGVAVYVRVPGTTQFRASVTWTSDTPIPHSPHIPEAFGRVLETGDVLILPDLAIQPLAGAATAAMEDVVRALVAVPIMGGDAQVIGTLCVFDLQPLVIGDAEIAALRALGQSVSFGAASAPDADDDRTATSLVEQPSGAPDRASVARPLPAVRIAPAPLEVPVVHWPTAILDRTNGEFAVRRELARARRERVPVSIVMFDVSLVGSGAAAPSESLVDIVGDTLLKAIRQYDLPVMWSADELIVVLPGLATVEARAVAERVRAALHAGAGYRAEVSAGVAEVLADDSVNGVVKRAKDKVRVAVERGHNRVA
jgi:GGDEF domain-containing protein/CheY-like chemotaxis protein